MRRLCALALAAIPLTGAIFPERIGEFKRGQVEALTAPDAPLYREYGFQEAEQAEFSGPAGSFKIAGWKVKDSTGALALFEVRVPENAISSNLAPVAAETSNGAIVAYGNFVLEYSGRKPEKDDVENLLVQLRQVERSTLPGFIQFLPKEELIPNSERYILGPVSLERFAPKITPSLAALHLSMEGQTGRYKTGSGELTMVLLSYPLPNMARERQAALLEAGAMAKRSGSLVAVIFDPPNADDAERVLARVNYESNLSRQSVGTPPAQGLANIVLTGFLMAGIAFAASLLAGIWLGGFANLLKRFGWYKEKEAITVLRIGQEPSHPSSTKPVQK